MAFKIEEFISQLNHKGVSYKSDFELTLTFPNKLQSTISTREIALRSNRCDIPGRSIQTAPVRQQVGPERLVAYNVSHMPITSSIILDAGMEVKKTLEAWQDLAVGHFRNVNNRTQSGKFNIGYYDDYVGTMEIKQYERPRRLVYHCRLNDCYPLTVNPLDADWGTDNISELTITWAYHYFEVLNLRNNNTSIPVSTRPGIGSSINDVASTITRGLGNIPTLF